MIKLVVYLTAADGNLVLMSLIILLKRKSGVSLKHPSEIEFERFR